MNLNCKTCPIRLYFTNSVATILCNLANNLEFETIDKIEKFLLEEDFNER